MKEIRAFCDICGREISPGIMNNKRMDLGYENKKQTNFKLEDVCNSCQCKIINYITELMKEGK